ncbi:uncharacterized protein LOC123720491 [Pieris brassicae]|uniref:uncharacterized protein LOC123720491 n=1 Tax=Pieris brassicae TaxID=7116 RepID=UPI001E661A4D|nr:uncharacterized protein LOC123720491 [Pieris brassicae]
MLCQGRSSPTKEKYAMEHNLIHGSISNIKLKLEDIQDAHNKIKNQIIATPLLDAKYIGKYFCKVMFKCENLQTTGSFKARGVCNLIANMETSERSKGITVSGGRNFLSAISYYGLQNSIPINVVIPKDAPLADKQRYRESSAIVKCLGCDATEASLHALNFSRDVGSTFVRSTDKLELLAGYGTVGLEILTQVDKLDAVLCPVGSGGLVASVLLAIKTLKPNCLIYGVECSLSPTVTKALQEKKPVPIQTKPNIADSLSEMITGTNSYNIIRGYLDKMITVDDTWISRAMVKLFEREKMFVEGAAACPVAAMLAGKVPELRGKNVVVILSGGNINSNRVAPIIERGLLAEGRLLNLTVTINDSPGSIAKLIGRVTDAGADIRSISETKSAQKDLSIKVKDDRDGDLEQPHILSFHEIKEAAERIDDGIIHTPLCEAKISKQMDYNIYFKCENLQYTGSCAERGIRNAFVAKAQEMRERGVIVPSSGNMGLAAAYHSTPLGIPVTVVLPERVAPANSLRCSELGADVVHQGENIEGANYYAQKAARDSQQILLCSDDPMVMAGLGTIGVEIITQLPEADAVIVPVATGSLLAAVLVACKKLKCSCLVYGVECSKVPKMMKALQAGKPETTPIVANLAQNLNAAIVGTNAFATIKGRLDRMLLVDECYIAKAIVSMVERERLVADGAGVCSLAAVMQGLVPELRGKRVVCVISSGNIDAGRLARTIQRGLGATGRLLRFGVAVPDHPSGLEQLAKTIADEQAVMKSLVTEQMWVHSDVLVTWANIVVETADEGHSANLKDKLRELYPSTRFAMDLDNKHKVNIR